MPHWRELIPSDYLRAESEELRTDLDVTIVKIDKQKLTSKMGKEQIKGVLYFSETPKKLAMNVIGSATIEAITGTSDWTKWIGQRITLFATTDNCFGDPRCPVVRIRDTVPAEAATK